MSDHTKEPWQANHNGTYWQIDTCAADYLAWQVGDTCASKEMYRRNGEIDDHSEANAKRIVTCINACAGLSNEEINRIPLLLKALDGESDIDGAGGPNAAMRFLSILKDADSAWLEKRDQERAASAQADPLAEGMARALSLAIDSMRGGIDPIDTTEGDALFHAETAIAAYRENR